MIQLYCQLHFASFGSSVQEMYTQFKHAVTHMTVSPIEHCVNNSSLPESTTVKMILKSLVRQLEKDSEQQEGVRASHKYV